MLLKFCTQDISTFWKLSSGHRTGKGQFSFQSQRRAIPKNVQPTIQMYLFHKLARLYSKSFKLVFSSTWTNFQMYKLDSEKAEEPEIKFSTFVGSWKKQMNSRKTSISASLTMLKFLSVWITTNCGKFLKRWEYQTTLSISQETCRSRSNSLNQTWNNGLIQIFERSMANLCIVTLLA